MSSTLSSLITDDSTTYCGDHVSAGTPFRLQCSTDFATVETEWRAIELDGFCSLFQTFDWLSLWYRYVGFSVVEPHIVTVRDDSGELCALLPLGIRKGLPGRTLVWLGGEVSTYHGPILSQAGLEGLTVETVRILFAQIHRECCAFDVADLERQPEWIAGWKNPFAAFRSYRTNLQSHLSELIGDWPGYYAGKRSSKTRSKERRRAAKLREMGIVEFRIARTADEIEQLLDELFREKSRQFREIGTDDLFADSQICSLYRDVMPQLVGSGRAQLSGLFLDDEPLAVNLGVIHNREFHGVFMTYREHPAKKLGPGMILIHHILEWCFANGIERFDFSTGDQDYKKHWCESTNGLYRSLWSATTRGAACVRILQATERLKSRVRSSKTLSLIAGQAKRFFSR